MKTCVLQSGLETDQDFTTRIYFFKKHFFATVQTCTELSVASVYSSVVMQLLQMLLLTLIVELTPQFIQIMQSCNFSSRVMNIARLNFNQ